MNYGIKVDTLFRNIRFKKKKRRLIKSKYKNDATSFLNMRLFQSPCGDFIKKKLNILRAELRLVSRKITKRIPLFRAANIEKIVYRG